MNLSEPFIRRPVMTTLVMLTILVLGILAYKGLPVSDLPNVDYPTIQVNVDYPGANPSTMANSCATPLENEFMTIDGLDTIVSRSLTGSSLIVLQFVLNKSLDGAALDVQSAINRAQPNLPKDLPYMPTFQKVNPSQTPILYYALTSSTLTLGKLYDYAYNFVAQRLSMIDGVSQVEIFGSRYAVRVQVNPELLSAKNIGINEVSEAIQLGNVDLPTGTLFGDIKEYTIDAKGQILNAEGYNELVLKSEEGQIVKIKDIGNALDSLEKDKIDARYVTKNSSEPCIVIAIQKLPGSNTVQIIKTINKLLPTIQRQLPQSIQFHTLFDKSISIIESVKDVELTLIIAFCLVVLIIFFVLGKLLNTIIPSLTLPLCVIGTFACMYLFAFSLDILSLLAITLSIGFLVDDAIVVLENNVRHVQMGEAPFEGTIKGSKEIAPTVLSMSFCLIAVFIPMLFMGGIIGKLFREFAVTIVTAVFLSGLLSLSLTPLLSSRFIPPYTKKRSLMENFAEKLNEKMLHIYEKILKKSMQRRFIILLFGLGSLIGSIYLFTILPRDFLPDPDINFLSGFSKASDGTSPFQMARFQNEINKTLESDPAVIELLSAASYTNDNEALFFVKLQDHRQRGPIDKLIKEFEKKLFTIPGVNSYLSLIPLINLQVGTESRALYQYALTSTDQETLNAISENFLRQMQGLNGLRDVSMDLEIKQPQLEVLILRDKASYYHITARQIENLLSLAYSGGKVSMINAPENQYEVIVETLPSYYKDPTVLDKLYIRSGNDQLVPFSEVVDIRETVGPLAIMHLNGLPTTTFSFNLSGIPLSKALEQIKELEKTSLPSNIEARNLGTSDVFQQSFSTLIYLLPLTIFIIYVILGILYENFIHPFTVMSTLPPATFGSLCTLFLTNSTLSLYSFVGIMMLMGIVMKNGIMMVDFANEAIRKERLTPFDAIMHAALLRFRPIMMTTIAALMGAVPIALGIGGSSAQSRRPLGMAVVGGLIFAQILTLLLTPSIYYYLETFREKIHSKIQKIKGGDEKG